MKRLLLFCLIILASVTVVSLRANANDGIASVNGQGIAPIDGEDDNVRLVREELYISFENDGYAYVDVTFYLKNESDKHVTLSVGFPDERRAYYDIYQQEILDSGLTDDQIDEEILWGYAMYAGWIEDFTATVNDEPVGWQARYQKVKFDGELVGDILSKFWDQQKPDAEFPYNLGPEFLQLYQTVGKDIEIPWNSFELSFAPGEEKTVHHTYRAKCGSSIGFAPHMTTSFQYTLVTGRSWKGKIDELVVTARLAPELDCEWIVGNALDEWDSEEFSDEELREWYTDHDWTTPWLEKLDHRTLMGIKRDWEPSSGDTPVLQLTAWDEEYYWMEDGIFPDSSTRLLTQDEIAAAPLSYVEAARYEIYARHGRPFSEETENELFYLFTGLSWYAADPTYVIPDDDDARLTDIERQNVEALFIEEMKRRYCEGEDGEQ
jgi:hypothetical protein